MPEICPEVRVGARIGSWIVESEIGQGAAGTVFRVIPVGQGAAAAMKVLTGVLPMESRRFEKEIAILKQVSHPRLSRFIEAISEPGVEAIVCELIEGGSLHNAIHIDINSAAIGCRLLPVRHAYQILMDILEGLDHLHRQGLLHRDLKPGNVLLETNGRARIVDFGLARLVREETLVTEAGQVKATLAYTAPEVLLRQTIDQRADLYALGIILFEMLTGELPFPGKAPAKIAMAHIATPPMKPSTLRPELSRWWDRIVGKLLEKVPEDRYETARDLIDDLVALLPDLVPD